MTDKPFRASKLSGALVLALMVIAGGVFVYWRTVVEQAPGEYEVRKGNYLFTSESVSEGHPDKICDRISDAIVDSFLAHDPQSRVAVETMSTTNRVVLAGDFTRAPSPVDRPGGSINDDDRIGAAKAEE